MNYEMVKRNYDKKLWGKASVKVAVKKGVITKAEYEMIVHEVYDGE